MIATAAKRAPQNGSKSPTRFCVLPFFFNRVFGKIPRFPLKRRLSRAFWPQGPPKAVPREAQGTPSHSLGHLGARLVVVFSVSAFSCENRASFFLFFQFVSLMATTFPRPPVSPKDPWTPKTSSASPLGGPKAPRSTQATHKRPSEHPKGATSSPQEHPKCDPRRLKSTLSDPKSTPRANNKGTHI